MQCVNNKCFSSLNFLSPLLVIIFVLICAFIFVSIFVFYSFYSNMSTILKSLASETFDKKSFLLNRISSWLFFFFFFLFQTLYSYEKPTSRSVTYAPPWDWIEHTFTKFLLTDFRFQKTNIVRLNSEHNLEKWRNRVFLLLDFNCSLCA